MRYLLKIIKFTLQFTCICLVSLVPKRQSVWAFGAWQGKKFSDNPKFMYLYVSSLKQSGIKPVWITKDIELASELRNKGVVAYYYLSFRGIYYQVVASAVFVGHSITSDLSAMLIGYNSIRIQLWHGIPLKKIGFDDSIFTTKNTLPLRFPRLYPLLSNERYDVVISTGRLCTDSFSTAFNVSKSTIMTTGFPRNDAFSFEAEKKDQLMPYRVIYMPTFRGGLGDDFDLFEQFGFHLETVESKLVAEGIELHIRTHPVNKPPLHLLKQLNRSLVIKTSSVSDIYDEISTYDCLITDYSSIMFDFALSNKPILLAPFDLSNYLTKDRELYYPYSDISNPNNTCLDWPDLIEKLIKIKNKPESLILTNKEFLKFHDTLPQGEYGYSRNVYKVVRELTS